MHAVLLQWLTISVLGGAVQEGGSSRHHAGDGKVELVCNVVQRHS